MIILAATHDLTFFVIFVCLDYMYLANICFPDWKIQIHNPAVQLIIYSYKNSCDINVSQFNDCRRVHWEHTNCHKWLEPDLNWDALLSNRQITQKVPYHHQICWTAADWTTIEFTGPLPIACTGGYKKFDRNFERPAFDWPDLFTFDDLEFDLNLVVCVKTTYIKETGLSKSRGPWRLQHIPTIMDVYVCMTIWNTYLFVC